MLVRLRNFIRSIGPGIVTGASDDDPSGIATYSQAGSQYGLQTLWSAFLTFPLMAAIQEMCGRIAIVTNKGLTKVIKENYPPWVMFVLGLVTIPAIILNIAADFAGMGAVSHLLYPAISSQVYLIFYGGIIILGLVYFSYSTISSVLKWLALVLLVYLIVPFFTHTNWNELLINTFVPKIQFTKEYLGIIVAILGTTISPYLFFWESDMEVEDTQNQNKIQSLAVKIKLMRMDNALGMFYSNIVMFFIIATAGTVLFNSNIHTITSVEDAAKALLPLAGPYSYLLFSIGVIGTGLLSIPVLAGVCGYVVAETANWNVGMNTKPKNSPAFYFVIFISVLMAVFINFLQIDPIQALITSAIIYGLIAPPLILIILLICNNPKIMGEYTNKWLANILGYSCLIIMTLAAGALLYTNL